MLFRSGGGCAAAVPLDRARLGRWGKALTGRAGSSAVEREREERRQRLRKQLGSDGPAQEGSGKRGKRRRLAGRREKGLAGQIERGEGMRNEEAFSFSK